MLSDVVLEKGVSRLNDSDIANDELLARAFGLRRSMLLIGFFVVVEVGGESPDDTASLGLPVVFPVGDDDVVFCCCRRFVGVDELFGATTFLPAKILAMSFQLLPDDRAELLLVEDGDEASGNCNKTCF